MKGASLCLSKNNKMKRLQLCIWLLLLAFFSHAQFPLVGPGHMKPDNKTAKQAEKAWEEGNFHAADSLYKKAYFKSNFLGHLDDLMKKKKEISDIKGVNEVYNFIIADLKTQIDEASFMSTTKQMNVVLRNKYSFEKIEYNFNKGDPKEGMYSTLNFLKIMGDKINNQEKSMFYSMYTSASEVAYLTENKSALEELNQAASKVKNGDYGVFITDFYLSMINGEYDKAISKLLEIQEKGGDFISARSTAGNLLALAYIKKGDNDKAIVAIENAKTNNYLGDDYIQNLNGIILLNKKEFQEAITKFSIALKGRKILFHRIEPIAKYRIYSNRAEAYLGIGDLLNARKDYESALVYNPNYTPAVEGLAKLEGKIITNRTTDKTPPEILVSEPAVNRGLKITSAGKDIMVKGMATDASGLKSVSINGIKVYAKEDGNFWGAVPLKDGNNQLTIQAIDMADNMAEKVFEIEKINPTSGAQANDIVPVEEKTGKNFILLIGSQNYSDASIPSLENPISDAIKLKLALKGNYYFEDENILTLFNPTVSDFKKKFIQISELLQPEDNLIIFYAGHGVWNEKEKKGYWLMTDAVRADVNTWLPNKTVLDMIANVPSRHTLLITDACFSGSVFKTRSIGADAPPAVREMSEKISRVAITSGNDTEVPDQSVFMKYLIKALNENKEKYLTAQKMFITQIIEAVMTESKTEPRYGTLELAGHVGGDFIFTKK